MQSSLTVRAAVARCSGAAVERSQILWNGNTTAVKLPCRPSLQPGCWCTHRHISTHYHTCMPYRTTTNGCQYSRGGGVPGGLTSCTHQRNAFKCTWWVSVLIGVGDQCSTKMKTAHNPGEESRSVNHSRASEGTRTRDPVPRFVCGFVYEHVRTRCRNGLRNSLEPMRTEQTHSHTYRLHYIHGDANVTQLVTLSGRV